ncbi:MAG: hypothetical protein JW801_05450 [Bacteroidales bacterium]|nr:hypothetical protein [Bacteroidales bacterium]
MRVAVLDLGTNTFNLVIAGKNEQSIEFIHSSKLPVKLGEGGINEGTIGDKAFKRGIDAISRHYKTIREFEVTSIRALGTSALRTAKNGHLFLEEIRSTTGIEVEIIDGEEEAELIYYGVRETFNMQGGPFLILDIGGGSNEFIIADHQTMFWRKSYPLGIARLLERFNPSDPLTPKEISDIYSYLEIHTRDLIEEVKKYKVDTLLGASGSFETFAAMIRGDELQETEVSLDPEAIHLRYADFMGLAQLLIRSTTEERKTMRGLEPMRIEMIVLASLFVKFILEKLNINTIYQTNYSLKEGVVYQLFKQ